MKSIIKTTAIACVIYVSGCNEPAAKESQKEAPVIKTTSVKFSKKVADFGTVGPDTVLTARYNFVNTGSENLIISELSADCTCTSHFLSNDTIAPKDSAYVELKVETKGKVGGFNVYALMKANTELQLYNLAVKGVVKQ